MDAFPELNQLFEGNDGFDTSQHPNYYSALMSAFWLEKTGLAWLAGNDRVIDTRLSLAEMPRVASAVLQQSGPFHVQFRFQAAQKGIVLVNGAIRGQLKLRCQRCLDELVVDVDSEPRLALLVNEQQLEWVSGEYEPVILPDGEVRVADLIEDEILLALPIAATHTKDACGPLDENLKAIRPSGEPETTKPFAGLAGMLRDQTD